MPWPYPERRPRPARWIVAGAAASLVVIGVAVLVLRDDGNGDAMVSAGQVAEAQPVTVTGAALPRYDQRGADPATGSPVPQIDGYSFDGTPVSTRPTRPTLLVFYAHWAQFASESMHFLSDWVIARGDDPAAYDIIVISTDNQPDQPSYPPSERFAEIAAPFPVPVLVDSETNDVAAAFGQTTFPWMVLVGADGNLLARFASDLHSLLLDVTIPAIIEAAPD